MKHKSMYLSATILIAIILYPKSLYSQSVAQDSKIFTSKGIVYLEKARQNDPRNSVLLYNLGRAYFNTSQFEKGNEIIGQLKQSSSDLSFISKLEAYKKSLLIN